MHDTYTYTARSAEDPAKIATFTLYNNHMRINLTGIIDQVSDIAQAEEKPGEVKEQLAKQAEPAMLKAVEGAAGPVHISDVNADLSEDQLQLTLWQRLGGLRLAPVLFKFKHVDNPDAAEAFVDELEQRKERSSYAGKFFGPLDYWLGWAGLLLLVGFLMRWPGRKNDNSEEQAA
jgi:hypothetical protein